MLFRYLTQVYNNYRNKTNYRSSLFSYLKLLFERNKKINSSYTNIGNVFKNSKWLNLKIQNVKQDFIVKWIPLMLIQLFILGWLYSFNTDAYFSDIYNILFKFYSDVISLGYYSLILFLSFIRFFFHFFKKYSISLEVSHRNGFDGSVSNLQSSTDKCLKNSSVNNYRNTGLVYKDFYKVKNSSNLEILTPEYINLNHSTTSRVYSNSVFIPNYSNTNNFTSTSSLKLNELNHLLSRDLNFTNLNDNLTNNFDSLRKDRWLLKNTLLDEDIIKNTYKYTMSKALIGSDYTKLNNVWASTMLSDTHQTPLKPNELKHIFTQNEANFNNFLSYNFFEESRFFLVKKYFFSNQINLNFLESQDNYSNILLNNQNTIGTTNSFFVISNLYNYSLNQHIDSLFTNTSSTTSENTVLSKPFVSIDNLVIIPNQNILSGSNLLLLNSISSNNSNLWYSYF